MISLLVPLLLCIVVSMIDFSSFIIDSKHTEIMYREDNRDSDDDLDVIESDDEDKTPVAKSKESKDLDIEVDTLSSADVNIDELTSDLLKEIRHGK